MNRSLATLASLGLVVALAPLACQAKVLSFDPTSTSALAEMSGQPIASLTETQASQVCGWLAGSYGPPQFVLPIPDSTQVPYAPGYLSGPAVGLLDHSGAALNWVALAPQSACVANLRHSACAATVASLEQCVQYFQSHTGFDGAYADAMTACAAFEGAAGCDETVFHAQRPGIAPATAESCANLLPVTPGATCEPFGSGSTDGGTE